MISIITVCYNSEKTIARTFASVLEQTVLPYEYIVIDGASNDKTIQIINDYKCEFEKIGIQFKFVSERDNGLYDAMNKGLSLACGNWLHFLNSDDFYVNKYVLQNVFSYLKSTTASIVYGRTINVNNYIQKVDSVIPETKLSLNMLIGCPVQQPATFYRRSIFLEHNYKFDLSYRISADYKMFVQMILDDVKFKFVPVFITCFDEGGISNIHRNDLVRKENIRLLNECNVNTILMCLKHNRCFYKVLIILFQFLSKL